MIGDRVRLSIDHPDENEELFAGDTGEIVNPGRNKSTFNRGYLVRYDKKTSIAASSNDHLIVSVFDPERELVESYKIDALYEEHSGHLWWTTANELLSASSAAFRSKKKNETLIEYKLVRKAAELDSKWKEKQNAKTCNLSL